MPTKDWSDYYAITKDLPPTPLLVRALEFVAHKNKAIDIGAGGLKNTRHLLREGFEVIAIDSDPMMTKIAKKLTSPNLTAVTTTYEDYDFPPSSFDLAAAMFALPFNQPQTFTQVFTDIKQSLVPGGIFAGQFFGKNDAWSSNPKMTFHTKTEIEELFAEMEIIRLKEVEEDGTTANGSPKHWHVFHILARKA